MEDSVSESESARAGTGLSGERMTRDRSDALQEFFVEYNETLSLAAREMTGNFGALASPTLSKQETVTFLYQKVAELLAGSSVSASSAMLFTQYLELVARLGVVFLVLLLHSLLFRIRALPAGFVYVRTWLVPRSVGKAGVKDEYFRGFLDDLRQKYRVVVGFQPLGLLQPLHGFRRKNRSSDHIIPAGLLSAADVAKLVLNYARSARVRLRSANVFRSVNITPVINRSLNADYFKLRSFQAYLDQAVAEKLNLFRPKAVFYIYENQSWEQAYLQTLDRRVTQTVAYQSSGFSFRFLNFFPSKYDADAMKFPDAILTVGDLLAAVLEKYGHYPVPLVPFAALRFSYPVQNGVYQVKEPRKDLYGRVLYAFAVHKYQYAKVVGQLKSAFADTKIEVVLKFHPIFDPKTILLGLPSNFRVWGASGLDHGPLDSSYDAVIFNDNSFGIEALILGVKSFEYVCEDLYSECRMLEFSAYPCTLDFNGMVALRDQLVDGTFDKTYDVGEVKAYVNRLYKPYTEDAFRKVCDLLDRQSTRGLAYATCVGL